jgi:hypothetical protein
VPESEPPAIVVEEVQGKMDTDTSKEESAAPAAAAGEEEVLNRRIFVRLGAN